MGVLLKYIGPDRFAHSFALNDCTYNVSESGEVSPQPPQEIIKQFGGARWVIEEMIEPKAMAAGAATKEAPAKKPSAAKRVAGKKKS